jgi:uncharacterized protein DUF433
VRAPAAGAYGNLRIGFIPIPGARPVHPPVTVTLVVRAGGSQTRKTGRRPATRRPGACVPSEPAAWPAPDRVTVSAVLGQLAAGHSPEEMLADYPYLERADILAALEFAADAVQEHELPLARPA